MRIDLRYHAKGFARERGVYRPIDQPQVVAGTLCNSTFAKEEMNAIAFLQILWLIENELLPPNNIHHIYFIFDGLF